MLRDGYDTRGTTTVALVFLHDEEWESMSPGWKLRLCGLILRWLVLATAQAQELPIFDAHIHYS